MNKGFTLLETIIYIAIVALVLGVGINLLFSVIESQDQFRAHKVLKDEAQFVLERIAYHIRRADSILVPETEGDVLELEMAEGEENSTHFEIREGKIAIRQGASDWEYLTSDKVRITDLTFINLTPDDTEGVVRVKLSLEAVTDSDEPPTMDVATTATLRE